MFTVCIFHKVPSIMSHLTFELVGIPILKLVALLVIDIDLCTIYCNIFSSSGIQFLHQKAFCIFYQLYTALLKAPKGTRFPNCCL